MPVLTVMLVVPRCRSPAGPVLAGIGRVGEVDDVRAVGVHYADVLVVIRTVRKGPLVLAHEEDARAVRGDPGLVTSMPCGRRQDGVAAVAVRAHCLDGAVSPEVEDDPAAVG